MNLYSDDISWEIPKIDNAVYSGARRGKDAVSEFFELLAKSETFNQFEPTEFIAEGDKVVVLTGRDKGRSGEVIQVLPKEDRAFVRGINLVKKHQKQTQNQEGGIVSKEAAIHLSNIAVADPKDGQPTRVGFRILDDGRKVRFAKRSGDLIDG